MKTELVDHFVNDLRRVDGDRQALVARLRQLVLSVDGRISEELKYGGILFSAGSPFCGIFSYEKHVSLEFSRGAALADPHHVLEGEGKSRRHIKLTSGSDLFKKNVRAYVAQAFQAAAPSPGQRGAARRNPQT